MNYLFKYIHHLENILIKIVGCINIIQFPISKLKKRLNLSKCFFTRASTKNVAN